MYRFLFYSITLFTLGILVLPILVIVPLSFAAEPYFTFTSSMLSLEPDSFSGRWYVDLFTDTKWLLSIKNSLIIGLSAATFATITGTMAALWLHKINKVLRTILVSISLMPMIIPHIITGVALFLFFAEINLINTYLGVILAHTIVGLPFVIISVLVALSKYDNDLTTLSYSFGAGVFYTFRKVTFPLIKTGIIIGWLFAFVASFDDLVITLFIAGHNQLTIPLQMWSGLQDYTSPTILSISTILTGIVFIILLALKRKTQ